MSAPRKCPLCRWRPRFRRVEAARAAARQHRCTPMPIFVRGCSLHDVQEKL